MAGAAPTGYSSGGMVTKLAAAKIATAAGCRMAIADGRAANPIKRLLEGARCSWFLSSMEPLTARKRWIAGSLKPAGALVVDAGAGRALSAGKSLLPAGVTAVEGRFERGDAVTVLEQGADLKEADAGRIIGHKSREIEAILGYRGREELIHRDDLVVSGRESVT